MDIIHVGQVFQKITQVKEHFHNEYEIIVTTDGNTYLYLDGEERYVQKGSVIVIPPNVKHSNLSPDGFKDLYVIVNHMPAMPKQPIIFLDNTHAIFHLMSALYTTWLQKDYNYKALSSALLSAINEYIIQRNRVSCKHPFVQALKDMIAKDFSNSEFNLTTQATILGVSKEYLRHCFKEDVGVPPLEYLTTLRIEQAKCLLIQNSYMTIHEIAQNCGFHDPYYFSRCFRKQTGVSPREFRNAKK